ncbi:MAG: NUDIX hydrolase, partial [Roseibium sp.]|nr:NUDIX hydrolase [Roseibium sp.]
MIKPWKRISSQTIIEDKWITLRTEVCQRSDGKIVAPFYVIDDSDFVSVLALTTDKHVVLTTEYRHGVAETLIGLPGGLVDSSDAGPTETAQRELLEETGYAGTKVLYLGCTFANPLRNTNKVHHVIIENVKRISDQKLDENEEIEVSL